MSDANLSPPTADSITAEMIAHAEQIAGLTFTADERDFMLEEVNKKLRQIEKLREIKLENSVRPPLYFNPRLPGDHIAQMPAENAGKSKMPANEPPPERPADLEDVAFWPLTQLAGLVRTQQVTSVELTQMYIQRLKRYGATLECIVTLTEDLALEQARRADEEITAGNYRGPLHGIPWGVKDLFATRGFPTTWGATPYKDQTIDLDATVVERLEAAGAVMVAKLTLGALAYGDIWFGGTTKNPWNLEEGSSGSSAGSASATAAGLVGFTLGTETLGSIVSPSTRCGATGLRPTFGRVSRHGAMTVSWSMDKVGPICRSVEDCALVFDAIYGPDGKDISVADIPFTWKPDLEIEKLRIGYVESAFSPPPETEAPGDDHALQAHRKMEEAARKQLANDKQVLETLRSLDIDLIPIELPDYEYQAMFTILVSEMAAAFDELTRSDRDDLMVWQDKDAWPNLMRAARLIPAVEYIQANRIRTLMMEEMAALMQDIDVFVVPSFGGNALILTNLTGHPAVVLPNGFTEQRTPTSITFIGNLYREDQVLAVAKAYQDATDFHLQYPPMDY